MNIVGPKKTPQQFGFKEGDTHVIVNDVTGKAKAFDYHGDLLWTIDVLAQGVAGPNWRYRNADTPPGLYKLGVVYRDYEQHGRESAPFTRTHLSYGWYSFDMVELENQEARNNRGGIMWHSGGTALGWPGAWQPRLSWLPYTHGCLRSHNIDLRDKLLPRYEEGTVFVSVYQDAPKGS